jgi:hypothetical protein
MTNYMTVAPDVYSPMESRFELSHVSVPRKKAAVKASIYVISGTGSSSSVVWPESGYECGFTRPVLSSRNPDDVSKVKERILSFRDYQDGWMGEGSKAPDVSGLEWFAESFVAHFEQHSTPAVFLNPDGDVEMEWQNAVKSSVLTVSLISKTGAWYSFFSEDNHDERDFEETLELYNWKGWNRLNNLIHGLFSIE